MTAMTPWKPSGGKYQFREKRQKRTRAYVRCFGLGQELSGSESANGFHPSKDWLPGAPIVSVQRICGRERRPHHLNVHQNDVWTSALSRVLLRLKEIKGFLPVRRD